VAMPITKEAKTSVIHWTMYYGYRCAGLSYIQWHNIVTSPCRFLTAKCDDCYAQGVSNAKCFLSFIVKIGISLCTILHAAEEHIYMALLLICSAKNIFRVTDKNFTCDISMNSALPYTNKINGSFIHSQRRCISLNICKIDKLS